MLATDSQSRIEAAAISRPNAGGSASHRSIRPCQKKRNAMALASAIAISSSFQRNVGEWTNVAASEANIVAPLGIIRINPVMAIGVSAATSAADRDPPEQAGEAEIENADPPDQHDQPQQVNQVCDRIDVAAGPGAKGRRLDGLAERAQTDPLG